MTIERATEVYAVVTLAVIGVSHIAQPKVWVEFFIFLRERGHAGVFFNGMLSLFLRLDSRRSTTCGRACR